jgi:23S rRNA maturation-related 3'-5' exoribonuclease YhaM
MKEVEWNPEKAIKEAEELLDTYLKDRKDIIFSMLFEQEVSKRFYTCPASTKLDHHCAFKGGLIVHSLSVTKMLLELREIIDIKTSAGDESIVIAGMFHDLGKIGDNTGELYLPETNEWFKNNKGQMYQYNSQIQQMPHSLRSIFIMQQFGIPLNMDEFFAIQYHDSLFLNQGADVKYNETSLSKALHFADMWSAMELEQRLDENNPKRFMKPW